MVKRIGILTGGGDGPGPNAVIRAVTRRSLDRNLDVVGLRDGWKGLVDGNWQELGRERISGILPRGGTILGTSRTNPFKVDGGVEKVVANLGALGLDALVAIGGEDTLGAAARLYEERQLPVVGVPKTIDNDLSATDYTVGFDTAVWICAEAIDRLHTTAESHNRVMVVEVMGRHTGWIAVMSGIAGGADVILIPEQPMPIEEVCSLLDRRHRGGKNFSIVVVSEGYPLEGLAEVGERDQFGHLRLGLRGVGDALAAEIEARTGFETRVPVLGHVQRGGSPTRTTACSQRASGSKLRISLTSSGSAGWRLYRARRSSMFPSPRRRPSSNRATVLVRGRDGVLRMIAGGVCDPCGFPATAFSPFPVATRSGP